VRDARSRTARLVASVTTIQDEKLADVRTGRLIRVVLHAEQGDLLPLIDAHVAGDDPHGAAGSGAVANPNAATAAAAAIRPFGSLLISPIASDVNFDLPLRAPGRGSTRRGRRFGSVDSDDWASKYSHTVGTRMRVSPLRTQCPR